MVAVIYLFQSKEYIPKISFFTFLPKIILCNG